SLQVILPFPTRRSSDLDFSIGCSVCTFFVQPLREPRDSTPRTLCRIVFDRDIHRLGGLCDALVTANAIFEGSARGSIAGDRGIRSEEHTSELQSRENLV